MDSRVTTKHLILVVSIIIVCVVSCSIVQPDHHFTKKIPHSYDFGSGTLDTLAVYAILEANDITADIFSTITRTGADLRIHSLDLSYLNIDTLPEEICSMGALEYVNLSHNKLSSLPDSIIKLRIYRRVESYVQGGGGTYTNYYNGLSIDHNRFCSVPPSISSWLDTQFKQTNYLKNDTTQVCTQTQ